VGSSVPTLRSLNRFELKYLPFPSPAFRSTYLAAYRELSHRLFTGGSAAAELSRLEALLATTDHVDPATLSDQESQLRTIVDQRSQAVEAG
jgi:hypothetical protein